jgi:hypothetical protein
MIGRPEGFAAAAAPTAPSAEAEAFYAESLRELTGAQLPFLVAGTYAVSAYTGIVRPTKDLDLFCRPGDYPRILAHFKRLGHRVRIEDERWIAKVHAGDHFFDVIFASWDGTIPVGEDWYTHARNAELFGVRTRIVSPTELVCSKALVQRRERYDGADIAHLILKQHEHIDWRRLLAHMDLHWEVLLVHLVNFRWIYPSERDDVPRWLMDELIARLRRQLDLPPPETRICRGRMFSRADYEIAVRDWGFVDVSGDSGLGCDSGSRDDE